MRSLLCLSCLLLSAESLNITYGPDRYPTGTEQCSWLNWIADRLGTDDIESAKKDIIQRVDSLGQSTWSDIGNGILNEGVFESFRMEISGMACSRNRTLVSSCVGLSDIACQFKSFAANDSTVMFNKTDGAVASPPNHKVVAENDYIRVINVYCPSGELETAFHTHTRLSFWITYGVPRGERYHAFDGRLAFDAPLWDRKTPPALGIAWNGPEWFHLLEEKELGSYLEGAPGNCPAAIAPNCSNGFKYRVELKLNPALDNYGLTLLRTGGPSMPVVV